jgi:Family of unknown function (DUF6516)
MIDEYYRAIEAAIRSCRVARSHTIYKDEREDEIIFLRGDIYFSDGSRLHFREFVQIKQRQSPNRYTYAYHYQSADGILIFRYDDTDHFPNLPTAPNHKHIGETDVVVADAPDLGSVLKEIEGLIGT